MPPQTVPSVYLALDPLHHVQHTTHQTLTELVLTSSPEHMHKSSYINVIMNLHTQILEHTVKSLYIILINLLPLMTLLKNI